MKIGVLFDAMSALGPNPDGLILESVEAVEHGIEQWGHQAVRVPVNPDGRWVERVRRAKFDLVFNLCEGIDGVAYAGVQVLPVKVLAADGTGQDSAVIAGVMWAADNGADVILMAFSNPGFSASLQDAVDYAWSQGVVLVAAAGNDGSNTATFALSRPTSAAASDTRAYSAARRLRSVGWLCRWTIRCAGSKTAAST